MPDFNLTSLSSRQQMIDAFTAIKNNIAGSSMSEITSKGTEKIAIFNSDGLLDASTTDSDILQYLDASSSIQDQLDAKVNLDTTTNKNAVIIPNSTESPSTTTGCGKIFTTSNKLYFKNSSGVERELSTYIIVDEIIFGIAGTSGCDYNFTAPANMAEQALTLTSALPKYTRLIDASIINIGYQKDGVATAFDIDFKISTTTGPAGEEIMSSTTMAGSTAAPMFTYIVGCNQALFTVPLSRTATTLYIHGTPDSNWDTHTSGKWKLFITYIDYGYIASPSGGLA